MSILIVEDDEPVARAMKRALTEAGHTIVVKRSWEHARQALDVSCWRQQPYDVVLLDLSLPDGDGRDLLPNIFLLTPRPAVAVVSGSLETVDYVKIQQRRALAMPKPCADPASLVDMLYQLQGPQVQRAAVRAFAEQHGLTEREMGVLPRTAEGYHVNEVAEYLGVKPATVSTLWRRIFRRTGWHAQTEVLAALFRFGVKR